MVLEGRGMAPLAARLATLLGNPVVVADQFFHFIASSPPGEHGDPHRRQAIMLGGTPRQVLDDPVVGSHFRMVAEQKRPVVFPPFPEHGMDRRRLMAPIIAGDDILGYVTVLEAEHPLREFHATVLKQAALVLAFELMKQRVALETELRLITDFLGDLFSGNHAGREATVRRAGFLGIDLFRPWVLLLVDPDDIDSLCKACGVDNPIVARQELFEIVRGAFQGRFPGSILVIQSESIVILSAGSSGNGQSEDLPTEMAGYIRDTVRTARPGVTVSVAIGGLCTDLEDFGRRYSEARRALDVIRSMPSEDQTIELDDLGILGILYRHENQGELLDFANRLLEPLAAYDRKRHTRLLETLETYLSENGAFRKTARRLFVHINTLRNRLQRIAQLCDLDLRDSKTRLNLQIALEVYRLAQRGRWKYQATGQTPFAGSPRVSLRYKLSSSPLPGREGVGGIVGRASQDTLHDWQ